VPTGDYQDLLAWRRGVVRLGALLARGGRPVVVPMSLLDAAHRAEILGGLRRRGADVRQVVLEVPADVLRDRIDADRREGAARTWRHAQLDRAVAELAGLADREAGTIEVRNHGRSPDEVAVEIVRRLGLPGSVTGVGAWSASAPGAP
jgi:predicted kinase